MLRTIRNRLRSPAHLLSRARISLALPVLLTGFILGLLYTSASAQELREYYITCDPDSFEYIIENPEENIYIDCAFEYDGETWPDARIRLRGDASRYYPKKSYKVNFDNDNLFFERDKVNLLSEWTDPSFSREFLAYDLYQRAGLYASLTWFAKFYVNGDYMGLYLDVEQVDEFFLMRTEILNDASIYKASEDGCFLTTTEPVEELWKKETNIETGFYDLYNLIEWLDTTPENVFFEGLGEIFPSTELARVIAVNSLIGNSSTYYHNYFLIHDLAPDGVWSMLPWDMDKTHIYWGNYDCPDYFCCGNMVLRPVNVLVKRCWLNESMRSLIFDQIESLSDSLFTESYYQAITDTLYDLLYDAVVEDTFKQFTVEDFVAALEDIPSHVSNRAERTSDRLIYDPLPFDLHQAILTPGGVYFSWDETTVSDSSTIYFRIKYSPDSVYASNITYIDSIYGTSLLFNDIEPGDYYWRIRARTYSDGKTWSLSFFSPFSVPEGAFSGTEVTGVIDSSITWEIEGSPYVLPEGLTVAPGAVLTIEPGVLIGLGAGQSLIIQGGLSAVGTEDDSIHFVPLNPDEPWGAITFDNPNNDIELSFVFIYGGSDNPSGPAPGNMIQIAGGQVDIYDSCIQNGTNSAVSAVDAQIHFERVRIEYFQGGLVSVVGGNVVLKSCYFAFRSLGEDSCDLVNIENVLDSLEISSCSFFGGSEDAIDLETVLGGEIFLNTITGADDKGISVNANSTGIHIYNNIISDCDGGISVQDDSEITLYNSVITFNNAGLTLRNTIQGSGSVFARNLVLWENGTEIIVEPGAALDIAYSLVQGEEPYPGIGNINSDPHFIDLWNSNYHPLENSPLIDAGYGSGHPEFDFEGSPRIDVPYVSNVGAGEITYVDIGIYEFDPVYFEIVGPVVINEINYNSAEDFDPEDWIELYANEGINDLSGWTLRDSQDDHIYEIPAGTILEAGEYLVIARDTAAFSALFPEVDNRLGDLDFGFSGGGELIRLFDSQENIIDSLTYDDEPPWPVEPDGNGPTLELIDPSLPNEDPENWRASIAPHGSPGQQNGWLISPIEDLVIWCEGEEVHLEWSDVPDAEIYYIYRSTQPYFDIISMEPYDTSATSDYTDFGVLNEGCRYYRIIWE